MPDHGTVKGTLRGKLAGRVGCNPETVRYYEKIGLIPAPPRTEAGYRMYDVGHERRLSFILKARELGFAIDEIRGLLILVDRGVYSCADVQKMTLVHLADVKARIADLRRLQKTLERIVAECSGEDVRDCPVIAALGGITTSVPRHQAAP